LAEPIPAHEATAVETTSIFAPEIDVVSAVVASAAGIGSAE